MTAAYIQTFAQAYSRNTITVDLREVSEVVQHRPPGCLIVLKGGNQYDVSDSYETVTRLWQAAQRQQESSTR